MASAPHYTKLTTPLKYQHYALVRSSDLTHVLDCMRYDRASPFSEPDSHRIARIQHGDIQQFFITAHSDGPRSPWTYARWKSGSTQLRAVLPDELYRDPTQLEV